MGLARRRHFANKGRQVLAIEDELFGEGHLGVTGEAPGGLSGYSTLLAALETRRTGQLGDIVGTIQAQQDEIIRSPQAGVLIVQGGPGTGKTVVALHRAAYLLYTYRFPLEDQGVLVVGPNRVFLRYIEQVLPSLGEAGVELVVLSDLVPDVDLGASETRVSARVKGDARMARVLAKAVHDRERPLREDLVVPFGVTSLRLTVEASDRIVKAARRRFRRHNAARRFVETEVFAAMAATSRIETTGEDVRDRTRHLEQVREALERMWPVLTPGRAAARPLRLPRPAAPRRLEVAVRRRVDGPLSPPPRAREHQRQRCGLVGRRHRAPGRGAGAARPAGQPQQRRRRRGDPDLRPHRGRRGAGPDADAAADGGPPLAQRLDDGRRRHRAGHRAVRAGRLERGPRPPARPPPGPRGRAHDRLPHPRADHGHGQPHPAGRGAADRPARRGAGGRRPARGPSGAARRAGRGHRRGGPGAAGRARRGRDRGRDPRVPRRRRRRRP